MGRKDRDKKRQQATSAPSTSGSPASIATATTPSIPPETAQTIEQRLDQATNDALASASEAAMEAAVAVTSRSGVTEAELSALALKAEQAIAVVKVREKEAEEARAAAKQAADAAAERESEAKGRGLKLSESEAELKKKLDQVGEEERRLKAASDDLQARQDSVMKREQDERAGFPELRRSYLETVQKDVEQLKAESARLRDEVTAQRARLERERTDALDRFESESAARRTAHECDLRESTKAEHDRIASETKALAEERGRMARDRAALDRDRQTLSWDLDELSEKRKQLDAHIAQRVTLSLAAFAAEKSALEARLTSSQALAEERDRKLIERDAADRRFGNRTPEQVLQRLEELEKQCESLRKERDARPSPAQLERLAELEKVCESVESDRVRLMGESQALRKRLATLEVNATELESVRDHKRALETQVDLSRSYLESLEAKVKDLTSKTRGKTPFPECSRMDAALALQTKPGRLTETIPDLVAFTRDLQQRIASLPDMPRFYSLPDLQCFLGGLAASRLHLVQGISGTGKTSLPLAFAQAIGAGDRLIEVQAGWRDRHDLVGHYNAFEERFYEAPFLQALYQAQTPAYRERPFLVVLDEMNLSHPEQYFADILSALEQSEARQGLDLMTTAIGAPPSGLHDGGKRIAIPPNVWFVGTANRDETTKTFADKTYDRAHVMELPRKPDPVQAAKLQPREPLSMKALTVAFDAARKKYEAQAMTTFNHLQKLLAGPLEQHFRIGWGNRLERQAKAFIPVVMGAGGTLGEAVDHLLATKLLRTIPDRHENTPGALETLRQSVELVWKDKSLGATAAVGAPAKSRALIARELNRLTGAALAVGA